MAETKRKRRETLTLEQLEERKARLEAQQREVDERIKAKKAALSEKERKAETHAKVLLGGMYLSHIGVDWKAVDFGKVDEYLTRWDYKIKEQTDEELPLTKAKARLRNWEHDHNPWDSWKDEEKAEEE